MEEIFEDKKEKSAKLEENGKEYEKTPDQRISKMAKFS